MDSVIIGVAGLCFGALVARSCIPKTQLLPLVCSLVLSVIGVVPLLLANFGSLFNGLLFALCVIVAGAIYGAELWKRLGLGIEFSRWQLIWMSAARPGYLRATYDASKRRSEVEPSDALTR